STLARPTRFIAELGSLLPRLAVHELRSARVGEGVYRITLELANTGALPTTTALATRLWQPRQLRVGLAAGDASLLSGRKVQSVGAIDGGGRTTELQWTVAARSGSSVSIRAESPVAGVVSQSITLR